MDVAGRLYQPLDGFPCPVAPRLAAVRAVPRIPVARLGAVDESQPAQRVADAGMDAAMFHVEQLADGRKRVGPAESRDTCDRGFADVLVARLEPPHEQVEIGRIATFAEIEQRVRLHAFV